jgi:hypothetical protein
MAGPSLEIYRTARELQSKNCTEALHIQLVIIKQSTVLVYTVHSTIIHKYFSTNSKKDRVKNKKIES